MAGQHCVQLAGGGQQRRSPSQPRLRSSPARGWSMAGACTRRTGGGAARMHRQGALGRRRHSATTGPRTNRGRAGSAPAGCGCRCGRRETCRPRTHTHHAPPRRCSAHRPVHRPPRAAKIHAEVEPCREVFVKCDVHARHTFNGDNGDTLHQEQRAGAEDKRRKSGAKGARVWAAVPARRQRASADLRRSRAGLRAGGVARLVVGLALHETCVA